MSIVLDLFHTYIVLYAVIIIHYLFYSVCILQMIKLRPIE